MSNELLLLQNFTARFRDDPTEPAYEGPLVFRQKTDLSKLASIYSIIPCPFPPLYEKLILNYRWHGADLGSLRLLRNPPGKGFTDLEKDMFGDPFLSERCLSSGFVQFGRGADVNYDPACFDTKNAPQNAVNLAICQIVRLDHELILCHGRINILEIVASSFDDLVFDLVSE